MYTSDDSKTLWFKGIVSTYHKVKESIPDNGLDLTIVLVTGVTGRDKMIK